MKAHRFSFITLALLLAFASYQAAALSLKQWHNPGACPSLGPIPACYLVLAGFALGLLGHLGNLRNLFLGGLGFPSALALFASIGEVFDFVECPKTASGIPMCYLSLSLCIICWLLWAWHLKKRSLELHEKLRPSER